MTFKIASVKNDYKILLQAKKDSYDFLVNKNNNDDVLKLRLLNDITKAS